MHHSDSLKTSYNVMENFDSISQIRAFCKNYGAWFRDCTSKIVMVPFAGFENILLSRLILLNKLLSTGFIINPVWGSVWAHVSPATILFLLVTILSALH